MDQELTQRRRTGHSSSGLSQDDLSNVICILHPSSLAAFLIVEHTAGRNPQHILQNQPPQIEETQSSTTVLTQATNQTQRAPSFKDGGMDLALRFSSITFDPAAGFQFGRNPMKNDVNLDPTDTNKRVSNMHFRIYLNLSGVLMFEDTSTNGTIVDGVIIGGKRRQGDRYVPRGSATRMLSSGSVIEIVSEHNAHLIKFIVKIPARDGAVEEFGLNFQRYMSHFYVAEQRAADARNATVPDGAARGMLAAPLAGPPNPKTIPLSNLSGSHHGMQWSGGDALVCTGVLGKGAFAIVYQVARRTDGELFACKELEKARFVKNGILDQRLDNEMQIMKEIRHAHIVQYMDYVETDKHLYIIMEYVPCGDLAGYMQAHGVLPEHLAATMTVQILDALQYLHRKQITHRDIKPDNILLSSEQPFVVKLTDFGLSKVVKNNETFLKTFCGTLLYCAPEVFPHYDNYVAAKRVKRRLNHTSHSYGSSVDTWSYAAVLWYCLCGSPPFEGIVDPTGKKMFNRIMHTKLDIRPLVERGISDECIDLLKLMLNTDPWSRPDERQCLDHAWLRAKDAEGFDDPALLDASKLSIHDEPYPDEPGSQGSQGSAGGSQQRLHKRQRGELAGLNELDELDELGDDFVTDRVLASSGAAYAPAVAAARGKLFGELSQPNYQAGLPDTGTARNLPSSAPAAWHHRESHAAVAFAASAGAGASSSSGPELADIDEDAGITQQGPPEGPHAKSGRPPPRLPDGMGRSWRESMVQTLHVESESGGGSEQEPAQADAPMEGEHDQDNDKDDDGDDQMTPVAAKVATVDDDDQSEAEAHEPIPARLPAAFDRIIDMPVPASFFYDPRDPSTHNVQYASKVSGINFLDRAPMLSEAEAFRRVPEAALNDANKENLGRPGAPATVYGHLTTTADSFARINVPLTRRVTTWGRSPGNTVVWPDANDTRIPKVGFEIWFVSPGIEKAGMGVGDAWTRLRNLDAVIATRSRAGITVNGVPLKAADDAGRRLFGRVYSGDEVRIGKALTFVCTFDIGRARLGRPATAAAVEAAAEAAASSTGSGSSRHGLFAVEHIDALRASEP